MRRLFLAAVTATAAICLAACGSSGASGNPTLPAPQPATVPATTVRATTSPATTVPASTNVAEAAPSDGVVVTDAEVADMEKQLDDIDQLLSGVDSDLSHD